MNKSDAQAAIWLPMASHMIGWEGLNARRPNKKDEQNNPAPNSAHHSLHNVDARIASRCKVCLPAWRYSRTTETDRSVRLVAN